MLYQFFMIRMDLDLVKKIPDPDSAGQRARIQTDPQPLI